MLTRFFRALFSLTSNTEALAATVAEVNTKLRDRLGMDSPDADLRMIDAPTDPEPKKGKRA